MTAATTSPTDLTLVLAATGKTGRRVTDKLEALGNAVRRGSRSAEIPFDWHDETTWAPALEGITQVYLVYTPDLAVPSAPPAIAKFTAMAKRVGVRKIVLLSGRGEEEAQRCEQIVADSGIPFTVVRAGWFNQNFDEGHFLPMILEGTIALPAGPVAEPFIDAEDIADVAVAALTQPGHDGETYEVTGPRLMTFTEVAQELAEVIGRPVQFVTITHDAFAAGLAEHDLDDELIWLLNYLMTEVLDGRNAYVADGVQRALGRAPRDFRDYAEQIAASGAWSAEVAS
ncbi:MAG: NAD(P)H-binding protein [Planctomycetota bacterium]